MHPPTHARGTRECAEHVRRWVSRGWSGVVKKDCSPNAPSNHGIALQVEVLAVAARRMHAYEGVVGVKRGWVGERGRALVQLYVQVGECEGVVGVK